MNKKKILIVDDEASIRQLVKVFLNRHLFEVTEASNGKELFESLNADEKFDLIILDLMLPDIYGLEACKKIRASGNTTPVILLTAVHGEMNTVLGFEAGADDYIEKPFSAHVLLSRIQAILKRSTPNKAQSTEIAYKKARFGHWTFNANDHHVQHTSGKEVSLTKGEAALLNLFLQRHEEILTREKISEALGLDADETESRAVDVQVSRLRSKLDDKNQQSILTSLRNKGYILVVPVRFS